MPNYWTVFNSIIPRDDVPCENGVISPISLGLNPSEGESTCEGYDLRKHRSTLTSQTVESMSEEWIRQDLEWMRDYGTSWELSTGNKA